MLLTILLGGNVNMNTFLCFGEDGHVQIEIGPCSEETFLTATKNSLSDPEKKAGLSDDGCGTCRDIPLFIETAGSGYLNKFNLSSLSSVPETKFIFASYYPVEPDLEEKRPDNFWEAERRSPAYPKLAYINTNTTVLLN